MAFNQKALTAFIEISGMCQGSCPYCLRERMGGKRYHGSIMSADLFEKIVDRLFELSLLERTKRYNLPLINWGEPFLNPEISDILLILKEMKLRADLSSNFIKRPNIDKLLLTAINSITLSLSGFTHDSYQRIHGASLDKVLKNFNDFYSEIRHYSPQTKIIISWHRYTFNEHEFWSAYNYFDRPGVTFLPIVAYLNDLFEMLALIKGTLAENRYLRAEKDIFTKDILHSLDYHRERSHNYQCPAWNYIVINETGQLMLCCGISNIDKDHILGSIFEMSTDDIWKRKLTDPLCKECVSFGLARYGYSQGINNPTGKAWPLDGRLSYFKLWSQHNLTWAKLKRNIKKLPYSEKFIRMVKGIRK